jgi:hypothetical protein
MSRKNKNYRAWAHENPRGTTKEAWDSAWQSAQKNYHSLTMNKYKDHIAELERVIELKDEAIAGLMEAESELEAELALYDCNGKCDVETCRSCRADYLEAKLARLREASYNMLKAWQEGSVDKEVEAADELEAALSEEGE